MQRNLLSLLATLVVVAAVIAVAGGCSSDSSTEPLRAEFADDGPFLRELFPVAVPHGKGGGKGNGQQGGGGAADLSAGSVEALVDGAAGGVVQVGRYKLTFAPGAFTGVQAITIVDPGGRTLACVLGPEGLEFKKAVYLEVDLSGSTGSGDTNATIYWYDPAGGNWVDIGGKYKASSNSVVATLEHFSTYAPGRAGW